MANRHALRASVISAAGTLGFGLCADSDVVPDLDVVAEGIKEELEHLLARLESPEGGHAAGDAATPGYSARDPNPGRDAE